MHYISVKQRIKNLFDMIFHIDHSSENMVIWLRMHIWPLTSLYLTKNLFLYEDISR